VAILRVLDTLEKLEAKMADLYEWFASIFAADSEAAEFFYRMSLDETAHANLVRYYRRIASKDAKLLREVILDVEPLTAAIESINADLLGPKPSLEEALKMAIDLEINAAESHAIAALATAAPGLAPLLSNLGALDSRHHRALEEFAASGKSPFVSKAGPAPEPSLSAGAADKKPPEIPREAVERIEYYYQWYGTMDYYKVLGLKNYASGEQIRKAFHARAREFHPDRYPHGDIHRKLHEIFSYMTNAYATLMDPEERRKYDRSVNARIRK
jgi:rubrerythrin